MQVEPEIKTLTLPLDDFKTPDWWLNTYNVIDDHTQFFKKVVTINFENCKQLQPGITDEIIITQLKLSTNNSNNYISLGVFWVVGLLVLLILYHFKKNKSLVPIKSIEYEPKNQTDSKTLIVNYIGNNYTNPVLSLQEIAANTNVKGSDISKILIEQFSLSFKEYLNYVRITETKKLLKNSELNISEIAYLVGYNNVTHFNRVFKSTENISPNEYRIK